MRPFYKKCWVILLVLFISCEKIQQHYNTDPYSDSKNDNLSLIGFYWDDVEYVQVIHSHLFVKMTEVYWSIVKIDEKEFILVYSWVTGGYDLPMSIQEVFLIFPYQDVIAGKEYTTDVYPSVILGGAPYGNNIFLLNGEARNRFCTPIAASVKYTKKGEKIQGSFTARGTLEMADGSIKEVMLENGTFNFSYSSNYMKTYSVDQWLSEIQRDRS